MKLRQYQRDDVEFLKTLQHGALFNEMRTGKSPTILTLIKEQEYTTNIIVCPASLVLNWKKEVETWLPNPTVFVSKGTPKQRKEIYESLCQLEKLNPDSVTYFLIISYETLRNDLNLIIKGIDRITSLTIDEAHRLCNFKGMQSRKSPQVAKAVIKLSRLATHRYALTGTPTLSAGEDVWGILHYLYPNYFSSFWKFLDEHFVMWDTPWGSREVLRYKDKPKLHNILSKISTNRKRSEVMAWLPAKQYQTIELEATPKQRKAYQDVLKMFEYEEDGVLKVDASSVLAQLTRLRQICLAPSLLEINAPSAKEQYIMEWLSDNPTESVIIFSCFTSYIKQLAKKLDKVGLIHGQMTPEEKQSAANDFQEGKTRILLANIKSAGVGFTLDKAETAIFLDKHFVPDLNGQAEDRIIPVREENNHSCTIISLVLKDTVDQRIDELLTKKFNITQVVNNYQQLKDLMNDRHIKCSTKGEIKWKK
jgi:SNF2 family DNA or RNA helicase